MTPLADAAAFLAEQWPVFPCGFDKRPVTEHGFHDAVTDPAAARREFSRPGAAMIGVPTGEVSGLAVIDIDVKDGRNGLDWLAVQEERLPRTRRHTTQSGGVHLLFRYPAGRRIGSGVGGKGRLKALPVGVDVRGNGGYVIAPPSPGYAVSDATMPVEMPGWLVDLLDPPEAPRPVQPPRTALPRTASDGTPYGMAALARECADITAAADGQKHWTLNKAAFSIGGLVAAGELAEGPAFAALSDALDAIRARCEDQRAAENTLRQAFRDGMGQPRQAPPPRSVTVRYDYGPPPEPPPLEAPPEWLDAEPAAHEEAPPKAPQKRASPFALLDPRQWVNPAPPRRWIVRDWIPRGVVTALYGDGGTGKSLLAQQLLTSTAVGKPWLGLDVVQGTALGIMCEDDPDELHRRQEAINAAMGLTPADLGQVAYASRVGFDNALMAFDGRDVGLLTDAFADLEETCDLVHPDLIVWDTIADGFAGNENSRPQVRQFVQNSLGRLARKFNCAVVLCGHPSVAGITSGTGTGGSTAWNNTVRSRLYLTRPEDEDAHPDARILSRKKANYAARDGEIHMVWQAGCFVAEGQGSTKPPPVAWGVVRALLDMIEDGWRRGLPWSVVPQTRAAGRYLPFAAARRLEGTNARAVRTLVEEWMASGVVEVDVADRNSKLSGLRVLRRIDRE